MFEKKLTEKKFDEFINELGLAKRTYSNGSNSYFWKSNAEIVNIHTKINKLIDYLGLDWEWGNPEIKIIKKPKKK